MLPIVQQLLVLQERDQKIRHLQRELKDLPKFQQRSEGELAEAEAGVSQAKHKLTEIEVKIKSLELDIQTRRTSIARLKNQQYETRKNEEFQALGTEVKRYEKEVTGLEDKELEHMEQIEALRPTLTAAQGKLVETKKSVADDLAQIIERGKNIGGKLADLKTERDSSAGKIEEPTLGLYDRLLKSKGDAAVAAVHGKICGGCHTKVVLATLIKLKANEEITQCEHCGRILFTEE